MFNILAEVNSYLESNIELYSTPVFFEVFPDTTIPVIMVRSEPGNFKETTYMDGSRTGVQNFAYYCRSADMEQAKNQLEEILEVLDIPEMIDLTEVCQVKIEPRTNIVFVGKTDDEQYIFTASLGLEYYKEAN